MDKGWESVLSSGHSIGGMKLWLTDVCHKRRRLPKEEASSSHSIDLPRHVASLAHTSLSFLLLRYLSLPLRLTFFFLFQILSFWATNLCNKFMLSNFTRFFCYSLDVCLTAGPSFAFFCTEFEKLANFF